jgi:uncharacterized protein (DUF433 family)
MVSSIFVRIVNLQHMELKDIITVDPEVLEGQPVFKGTRVPVETLFDHLEAGIALDEFLDDFPSVTKEQAKAALEIANTFLTSKNVAKLYETAA